MKCIEHRQAFDINCQACRDEVASSKVLNSDSEGRILFAITLERWNMRLRRWEPNGFTYTHAISAARARYQYEKSPEPGNRIIAIAPVIGYNVLDNHGDKLQV